MLIFNNREDMIQYYIKPYMVGCELGVFAGDFAKKLYSLHPSKLYLIDCWKGDEKNEIFSADENGNNPQTYNVDILLTTVQNFFSNKSEVEIIRDYTNNAIPTLPDNSLDYVYIDADHSYEGVKRDLELILPKMKQKCMIMGHDYDLNLQKSNYIWIFGVKKAVDEFCKKHDFRLIAKAMDGCVSFCLERMGHEFELNITNIYDASSLYLSGIFVNDMIQLYSHFHNIIRKNTKYNNSIGFLQTNEELAIFGVWKYLFESIPDTVHYLESITLDCHILSFLSLLAEENKKNIQIYSFGNTELIKTNINKSFACMNTTPQKITLFLETLTNYSIKSNSMSIIHISSTSTTYDEIVHLLPSLKIGGYFVVSYANGSMQNIDGFTRGNYAFGKMIETIVSKNNLKEVISIGHLRVWKLIE